MFPPGSSHGGDTEQEAAPSGPGGPPRCGGPDGRDRFTAFATGSRPEDIVEKWFALELWLAVVTRELPLESGPRRPRFPPLFRSAPRVEDVLVRGGVVPVRRGERRKRRVRERSRDGAGRERGEAGGDEEVERVRQDTGLRVALRRGAIGARGGACAKVVQSEVSGQSGLFPVQAGDARSVEVSDVVVGGLGACLAVGLTTYVGACVSVSVGVWEDMCVCVCV